jgi:hypothetical protein
MSTPANAELFEQPHWRVIARGFDTERWFNDGQAVGTGGIANPQPTRLPTGQYYYRFASSASSRHAQRGSGWWLDFENFSLIRRFAGEHGYTLREAARLMLALQAGAGRGHRRRSRHALGSHAACGRAAALRARPVRPEPDQAFVRDGVRAAGRGVGAGVIRRIGSE